MKNLKLITIILALILTAITACNKEEDDTNNNNSTTTASDFVGTYSAIVDCGNGANSQDDITVSLGLNDGQVVFQNFLPGGFGNDDITVSVSGKSFNVAGEHSGSDNWTINGSGNISDNLQRVTIDYNWVLNGSSENCTLVMTRK